MQHFGDQEKASGKLFVQATGGEFASLGIGKQIDRIGSVCSVEYFDSPTADTIIHAIDSDLLQAVTLPEQTRVYHFNLTLWSWEIGRLTDDQGAKQYVRFPNGSDRMLSILDVFVRWARPIVDPTPFLAGKINETPRFSEGRRGFIRSLVSQRAATMGMSALMSYHSATAPASSPCCQRSGCWLSTKHIN